MKYESQESDPFSASYIEGPVTEHLSATQRERRLRILEAALTTAEGGYDAVTMRAVASRSGVAMATLYYYFWSKEHLLVCTFGLWLLRFEAQVDEYLADLDDPFARAWWTMSKLTESMNRSPLMGEALARAYVFADARVASEVEGVRALLIDIFADVMSNDRPRDWHICLATVLTDGLASNLLAMAHGRRNIEQVKRAFAATLAIVQKRHGGALTSTGDYDAWPGGSGNAQTRNPPWIESITE